MSDDNITGRFQLAQPQAGPIQGIGFSLSLWLSDPLLLSSDSDQDRVVCGYLVVGGLLGKHGGELGGELGENLALTFCGGLYMGPIVSSIQDFLKWCPLYLHLQVFNRLLFH